jgi:asparagine synthase (glutamine-hydrolysing)
MLRAGSVRDAHDAVRAIWEQVPMRERPIPPTEHAGTMPALAGMDPAHAMMLLDLHRYLPDDILVKLDRAAMSVSLETRAPFLDARVVEFAWQLPLRMKLRNGTGKWITRELLSDYVPRELLDRPKSGFGIPLAAWLRGPMRAWADRLLAEDRLESTGFLCPRTVRAAWSSHLGGRADHSQRIWTVLMLQGWLEQQGAAA